MKNFLNNILRFLYYKNVGFGTRLSIGCLRTVNFKEVSIGRDCLLSCRFSLDRKGAQISVGDRCFIGKSHLVAAKNINIGNDVIMSWGVTISDHDSHSLDNNLRARDVVDWGQGRKNWDDIKVAEVVVENNVWIGFNAIILKGVTLGQGSIVGAGSVVTRDVPPYSVVAGNPARVIKVLDQQVKTIYE